MKKFLIIQTAFIGDVVLALPVAQRLRALHPEAEIHFLVRQGNEGLLENHPAVNRVWIWQKKKGKIRNLWKMAQQLRKYKFDAAYNLHRFASSGFLMMRVKAKRKVGFDKNPLSIFYTRRIQHQIPTPAEDGGTLHEVHRNLGLLGGENQVIRFERPKLYPSEEDFAKVREFTRLQPYIVMAPASVWFTKQWHPDQWKKMLALVPDSYTVFLIGGPGDREFCRQFEEIQARTMNLCGKLSLLQSAALMQDAKRVFVNDSAPQHFASAMNAPTTAIFCSTVPEFGFGPLSEQAVVLQTEKELECRPCGLHGHKSCPLGHFDCAFSIDPKKVWETVE